MKIKTKFSIDKYIEFTSVLMVFLQGFVIRELPIVDLKLYYLFLGTNSLLLLHKHRLKIHKNIIIILLLLIVHAVLTYTIYSTPWIYFIKQIVGMSITIIYFYNVFRVYDTKRLFAYYLKLSIVSCLIALAFYPTGLLDDQLGRMDGLMTEPSKFIAVLIPSLFYFVKERKIVKASIIIVSFILATSSLGYLAIMLVFLLLLLRKETLKYLGLSLIPLFFIIFYLKEDRLFKDRLNSTIENVEVFETRKFPKQINVSTFVLLKNTYIAFNNFKDHPIGTGIGSYGYKHDYYLKDLTLPPFILILGIQDLNKEDASSLFLRVISDFGVFGLILVVLFLYIGLSAHFKKYDSKKKTICIGMFVYFLIKLIRMGHYFPEEMYFFLFLFIYNLPIMRFNLKS